MGKHWTMALGLITNQPLLEQCRELSTFLSYPEEVRMIPY